MDIQVNLGHYQSVQCSLLKQAIHQTLIEEGRTGEFSITLLGDQEMEKLNKLRVDEIQKTYDSYIGYLNTEKKSREQEVKEAQVALDKEMNALEQTTRKLEQTVADKAKHQALDNGEDVSDEEETPEDAPEEGDDLDE